MHTTFSADAFMRSLPLLQSEGAHPPADACDFARFCSDLDFWSINDHAEALTPQRWRETQESIRHCNEVAGDPASPDLVAFLGWEWTQVGRSPADHFGHKNVVLRDTDEALVPARPISAAGGVLGAVMRQRFPFRLRAGLWGGATQAEKLTAGPFFGGGAYLGFLLGGGAVLNVGGDVWGVIGSEAWSDATGPDAAVSSSTWVIAPGVGLSWTPEEGG